MQPFTRSPHLVALIAQAERLATALTRVPPAQAGPLADRNAVASVALDGSPIEGVPQPDVIGGDLDPFGLTERADGDVDTWLDALGVLHTADARVIALEWQGVRRAAADDQIGQRLLDDPVPALAELHAHLTQGLVAPELAGQLRRSDLTVQDRSVGRILYFPADPDAIPARLAALAGWLVSDGAREHALVASGVVHLELLAMHPFESANGRLARTAARLMLRTAGLDPAGVGLVDEALMRDSLGYQEEVARTQRRRDLTIWLERWAEAVVDGLRAAGRELGVVAVQPSARAVAFLATADDRFTVADYRAGAGGGLTAQLAATDLEELLDAGLVRLAPASRGLRYVRVCA